MGGFLRPARAESIGVLLVRWYIERCADGFGVATTVGRSRRPGSENSPRRSTPQR